MRHLLAKVMIGVALALASGFAMADLPILVVEQSQLPYGFSPSNYDNSESNYDNSISNYDNSGSNYDNSESNYDNSSSNYDNSPSGTHRLIYSVAGTPRYAGYYVTSSEGVTNFFSPTGARMFYNPKSGSGVFSARDGSFCGVLAESQGRLSLVLTDHGVKVMLLSSQ